MLINGKYVLVSDDAIAKIETGRYRNAYKVQSEFRGPEGASNALAIFDGLQLKDGHKARLRVDGAIVAVRRSERDYHGTPPHDAARATGMYDRDC